ncbi:hypothetical protein G6F59_015309 [Rhizopus arrhizus]|nr:hypothetical protein G6F59_015309 [Rhizopus arrhizus]
MGIGRTRDDRFITIGVHSTVSSEERYAPASDPTTFTVLAPRQRDVEYDADHYDGRWVIRTNDGAKNFKLVTAPTDATSRAQWKDWIAHDDAVFIEGFELFDSYTAIAERSEGLERIRLLFKEGGKRGVWLHPDGMDEAERARFKPRAPKGLEGAACAMSLARPW